MATLTIKALECMSSLNSLLCPVYNRSWKFNYAKSLNFSNKVDFNIMAKALIARFVVYEIFLNRNALTAKKNKIYVKTHI